MCKFKRVRPERSKKQVRNQKLYVFQLRKLKNTAQFDPIMVDFNAIPQPQDAKPIPKLYPFYLKDSQPFTPSFVYPILGPYDFSKIPAVNIENDEEKEKEEDTVCITRAEPQPGIFCRVCGVCRRQYDEYFSHIQSEIHKNWLRQSVYQKSIKEFCETFSKLNCPTETKKQICLEVSP